MSTSHEKEAERFRSLACQQRRNSHMYRGWAREAATKGHRVAEQGLIKSAEKYAADALWYWRRSRRPAVQFNTEEPA